MPPKTIGIFLLVFFAVFSLQPKSATILAKSMPQNTVITFGEDLTPQERLKLRKQMNVDLNVKTITVTNSDEYKYLGKHLKKTTVGTRAISSAKITIKSPGTGISVNTRNITKISESMYENAAITAGMKDVDILIIAPYPVSGTAGLTGIIKAFESITGKKLNEQNKFVANEEMVRTSEIGQWMENPDKAAQFMNRIKEELAKREPQTRKAYQEIVENVSNEFNIQLNDQMLDKLIALMKGFTSIQIDWSGFQSQLSKLQGAVTKVLNDPQTKNILQKMASWVGMIFRTIGDFISSFSTTI